VCTRCLVIGKAIVNGESPRERRIRYINECVIEQGFILINSRVI